MKISQFLLKIIYLEESLHVRPGMKRASSMRRKLCHVLCRLNRARQTNRKHSYKGAIKWRH